MTRPGAPARVLYVEDGAGFGGAPISLRTFLEHADGSRYEAVLAHSLADPKFDTFAPYARCVFVAQPRRRYRGGGVRASVLDLATRILPHARRLTRLIRAEGASLVYLNNDVTCNLAGIVAAKTAGRPVIVHERDIPSADSRLARLAAARVDRFLAISIPCKEALVCAGADPDRIRMVPEGLDFRRYEPSAAAQLGGIRRSLGVAPGAHLILMAGMLTDWKGQHVLLGAAPQVLEAFPESRFALVGEPPAGRVRYAETLKEKARRPPLAGRVVFTGYRTDLPALMEAADVVVHASTKAEPFGRVVIEAMAMGTPIVSTQIGAPPEIVRDGETGILLPPGDPAALAETLCRLLKDEPLRSRLGAAARRDVRERYSIQRHVATIQGVFEELLPGDDGHGG